MKEMYKDNAGNWHYGYKGEKLTEVSYSANSVPNSIPIEWIRKYTNHRTVEFGDMWVFINCMINDWEKENEESSNSD